MPAIARRRFQGAQHGYGSERKALFHQSSIDIPATGDAARQPAAKAIMPLDTAGHILAMQQRRKPCRRRRTAITPRGITAAGLTARRCGYAGKPDYAIAEAERFAIKNADLRSLSRNRPIRRGRAKKIGRQAKPQEKRCNHRANKA